MNLRFGFSGDAQRLYENLCLHSKDGLGRGGPRLKWAKGRFGSKNDEKVKVLRMEFSIVENLSGLQESIFSLSRGPQLHLCEKFNNWSNFIKFIDFPPFPLFGVPWAAVIRAKGVVKGLRKANDSNDANKSPNSCSL